MRYSSCALLDAHQTFALHPLSIKGGLRLQSSHLLPQRSADVHAGVHCCRVARAPRHMPLHIQRHCRAQTQIT